VKKCRFHNPDYLSLYYDGALDEAEEMEFSRHLLTCRECMDALLQLERDLFLMSTSSLKRVPRASGHSNVVFRFLKEGIELKENIRGEGGFVPQRLAHAGEEEVSYVMERDELSVEIRNEGNALFGIEVKGVSGKKVRLFRGGRLLEARSHIGTSSAVFHNLIRGTYSIAVNGLDVVQFDVE